MRVSGSPARPIQRSRPLFSRSIQPCDDVPWDAGVVTFVELFAFFVVPQFHVSVHEAVAFEPSFFYAEFEPFGECHRTAFKCLAIHCATGATTPFPHCL